MIDRLNKIIEKNKKYLKEGELADYIPELAKANREDIALCLKDSQREYKLGDYKQKFTIQSISKVIVLMLAIIENGSEKVFRKVGCEGTSDPFNTMHGLTAAGGGVKPVNPMINAGAILTTSLIAGDGEEKFNKILNLARKISENDSLDYSREVYKSESRTGDRNKAIAYIMKSNNIIKTENIIDDVLDPYFKQCSIEANVEDLASMAEFIAKGCKGLEDYGRTTQQELTKILMAVMTSGGMYNYSGQYAIEVGIPSKSGVAGGIIACVPGKVGIAVYSPGLDQNGNSKVGLEIMKDISRELNYNIYIG